MNWGETPELVGPRHAYRVRRLADLLQGTVPRGQILDAGCGAGTLTEILAKRGYRVTAVDASPEFVAHVKDRMRRAGLDERVDVHIENLEGTELPDESFDGAVCGEVLEHLADDGAAVRGIARALKFGGALVLSVPARPDRFSWLDRWAGHHRRYDADSLRALLTDAGLRIERLIQWGFPFMALYERFVQSPGLAQAAQGGRLGRFAGTAARTPPVRLAFEALFNVDRLLEGRAGKGTGFFAVARKP